ncbi:MAG: exo-alpha-sialidase [Verrucomicrobia bacterium]|jgi:sialidase-1|nr:exo-alpha-sialidase [Verrucomicrobiota bacterium]
MTPTPRLSRRHFLSQVSLALALSLEPQLRANSFSSESLGPIKPISHLPHRYHGWSTLARRRNGQLVLSYSGGRQSHVCPFGRVEFMTSHDDGLTWTWPQVIHDGPIDDRDSGILETSRGTLLASTFTSLAYEPILTRQNKNSTWSPSKLKHWRAAHNRLNASEREARLGQWIQRSEDGGATWSSPASSIVNSPHGPIQLSDGRLLYAGKELWTGQRRVGVAESKDDGKTWTWLSEIPTRKGDQAAEYHELHAIETADNRIIVQIRNHNPQESRETLQSESVDGGATWTTPKSIGVWGLPSHLLRLHDDRLLMSYGYRRKPFGNQARISEDHGRTWSAPITISADGHSGDLGYPSTVELEDHSLLTVWYEQLKDNPHAVLRQARWRLKG